MNNECNKCAGQHNVTNHNIRMKYETDIIAFSLFQAANSSRHMDHTRNTNKYIKTIKYSVWKP